MRLALFIATFIAALILASCAPWPYGDGDPRGNPEQQPIPPTKEKP